MTPGTERSVRRRLLVWLLVPLSIVLLASGIASYRTALGMATDAYDRSLLDPALAIASTLRVEQDRVVIDLPKSVLDALRVDSSDRLFFSVTERGRLLAGQQPLPAPPHTVAAETPLFYDAVHRGEPVRVAALVVTTARGPVLVQAAETRSKRNRLARRLLLEHTGLELLVLVVAFAAVWIGVGRGLAPVEKLRAEIAKRSHRDLSPLPESQAPDEVRPLVLEMNELLRRLALSMELQQQFVADAAHQLRTPLAGLQAQAEAARREALPPALAATVDQLLAATGRASHLLHQLLTLASLDPSAERAFAPQALDLADLLKEDLSDWIQRADARRIDLGFELESAPARGEPALLAQLAANLLDNAIKYTRHGGEVTVRTGVRDGRSFFEVEDNGPGIPLGERDQVFERFHRVKGTPGPGAGLGLAIVREIAHRHHAQIELATPAGGGTRICVYFPGATTAA